MEYVITRKEQIRDLWTLVYRPGKKPDWSHIIPYYHREIHFRDAVQEIHGIEKFTSMTERLARRSASLEMEIRNVAQEGNTVFLEWIMTLRYQRLPKSSVHGTSRVTLSPEGKIMEQRDYYDLWGDIWDHIPLLGRIYRVVMFRLFG